MTAGEAPAPVFVDGVCYCCDEWRQYPPGQEHFGWTWWRRPGPVCDHEHHRHEVWLA